MNINFNTRPEAIEVDLESTAVVVVDMQNAFAAKGGVFDMVGIDISPAAGIIHTIKGILKETRERRINGRALPTGIKSILCALCEVTLTFRRNC
jgi:hypothetical protein